MTAKTAKALWDLLLLIEQQQEGLAAQRRAIAAALEAAGPERRLVENVVELDEQHVVWIDDRVAFWSSDFLIAEQIFYLYRHLFALGTTTDLFPTVGPIRLRHRKKTHYEWLPEVKA